MFGFIFPEFRKKILQNSPLVILWQPRNKRDAIIEIQDADYRWSDDIVNSIAKKADDWTLTAVDPKIPQILLGGNPFNAMQTSMVFGGTTEESKNKFIAEVVLSLAEETALTEREEKKEDLEEKE